jgi:hypothetical protein
MYSLTQPDLESMPETFAVSHADILDDWHAATRDAARSVALPWDYPTDMDTDFSALKIRRATASRAVTTY